jgi:hypothetical protein
MTMPIAPDGILETLTVVASLDVHQPRTRLDVQQDVVPVKKQNLCVLVFVPVASAQISPTRIQTGTICQVMTMMVAYYSNLMAMTLDSMAYLKNNDGNARRYYLRSAVDQYLFTHSIFSFGSTVDKVNVWSWLRS